MSKKTTSLPFGDWTMLGFESGFEIEKTTAFSAFHRRFMEEFAFSANREPSIDLALRCLNPFALHCGFGNTDRRAGEIRN
jgi:hypothetical protein